MAFYAVESDIDSIIKRIYSSCDTESTNQVRVSVLIEFIKPYLLQDLSALETLKFDLDPGDQNKLISSQTFYEVMSEWTKKIASTAEDTGEFNQSINQELSEIEEKNLPFIQSTPRASFGQKLLNSENLLHLSNIPSPDVSISMPSTAIEKQALEEEVKRLDYQFNRISKEMDELKAQLVATEEQNEVLQSDVIKYQTQLTKLNEQYQNDKFQNDELKDEISIFKNQIADLTAKLLESEKQNISKSSIIRDLEKENTKLSDCCHDLKKLEELLKTDIKHLRAELELKCQEYESIAKLNNNMQIELDERKHKIAELENTLLEYKKNVAERRLSSKRYSSSFTPPTNLSKCSFMSQDYSFEEESLYEHHSENPKHSPQVSLQTELFQIQQSENGRDNGYQEELDNSVISEKEPSKATLHEALENLENKNKDLEIKLKNATDEKVKLQQTLTQLKKQCKNLNISLTNKEKECQNQTNGVNSLCTQLKQKTKELDESMKSCKKYKNLVHELAVSNQDLHNKVGSAKIQDDVNINETPRSNINELQAANRIFRVQINELENHLETKTVEINDLKDILRREIELKNRVWKDNKELVSKIDELMNKLADFDKLNKEIKEEYNNKLSNEVNKNCNLCKQNSKRKRDLLNISREYHEEIIKNFKLSEQISQLENEIATLRESNARDKERFNKETLGQKELIIEYKSKLESTQNSHEKILNELHSEKILKNHLNEQLLKYQGQMASNESQIRELENLNNKLTDDLHKLKRNELELRWQTFSLPSNLDRPVSENKGISFEKNKLMIDKLREKIENLDSQLAKEKQQSDSLRKILLEKQDFEAKLLQLKKEFDMLHNNTNMEKQSLQKLVDELTEKIKVQEEYYNQLGHASNEKIKELSLKVAQLDGTKNNLQIELSNRISLFKNQLEAKSNVNKKLNECLLNKTSQNQQLSKLLDEKETRITCLHQELEDLQEVKGHLNKNVEQLSLKVFQLECELSLKKKELIDRIQEKNNIIADLRNTNVDIDMKLSKTFMELIEKSDAYETLLENNRILQDRLLKTDDNKEKERADYEIYKRKLAEETSLVTQCCQSLHRGILEVTAKWYINIKQNEKFKTLDPIEEKLPNELGNRYFYLSEIVSVVVELLEILATKAPNQMNDSEYCKTPTSPELECLPSSNYKSIKKFTLQPAKLIVGTPASPDSPSLEIYSQGEAYDITVDKKSLEDPDSQFGDKENKYKEFGYLKKSESQLICPIHLSFDDAFPHLTDSFLEKLGLHEDSTKQNLTKEGTEKTFISFAMQIMLDSKDIKDRLEKQKTVCQEQHKKCVYLIKDISMRLRDHKCIGATDPINPIFVLLEDVRFLLQEIVQSAGQLGILSCENRMMRCWNLVTNYMSILKKESVLDSPIRRRRYTDKEMNTVDSVEEIECNRMTNDRHTELNNLDIEGYRCCSIKKAATWFVLFLFLSVTALISLHWHCRISSEEHQICVLDDFIRKVHIGNAPY